MGKLYFVRHGESIWNVQDKICGQTDSPLTDKGHNQAIETGNKIAELGIKADIILYSPLMRAKDTALHISDITGIPARLDDRLLEQNFGVWEGTSPRNATDFKDAKKQFLCSYGTGESMFRLAQRIYNLLDDVTSDKEHTYILVAHNGIARVVYSYFNDMTNEEYASYGVPNCSVTEFEF